MSNQCRKHMTVELHQFKLQFKFVVCFVALCTVEIIAKLRLSLSAYFVQKNVARKTQIPPRSSVRSGVIHFGSTHVCSHRICCSGRSHSMMKIKALGILLLITHYHKKYLIGGQVLSFMVRFLLLPTELT